MKVDEIDSKGRRVVKVCVFLPLSFPVFVRVSCPVDGANETRTWKNALHPLLQERGVVAVAIAC